MEESQEMEQVSFKLIKDVKFEDVGIHRPKERQLSPKK
jgi:hypothetical protein